MANRHFKIPQITVQRGFWNPATIFTHCVSLTLDLKEGVMKRSGEALVDLVWESLGSLFETIFHALRMVVSA